MKINQSAQTQLCALDTNFQETKDLCTHLSAENVSLKNTISKLRTEVNDLRLEVTTNSKKQHINNNQETSIISENLTEQLKQEVSALKSQLHLIEQAHLLAEKGISLEQQDLNSNIVIRGIDIVEKGNDSESKLIGFYDKIRTHLGIFETSDFKAVSAKILHAKPNPCNKSNSTTSKTIQVCLSSAQIKRQFLQIRRIKKDIFPVDIGLTQTSKKPILITEQLTRQNQELLFNARSLSTTSNFKFVWSTDGQILARPYLVKITLRYTYINWIGLS